MGFEINNIFSLTVTLYTSIQRIFYTIFSYNHMHDLCMKTETCHIHINYECYMTLWYYEIYAIIIHVQYIGNKENVFSLGNQQIIYNHVQNQSIYVFGNRSKRIYALCIWSKQIFKNRTKKCGVKGLCLIFLLH